MTLGVVVADRSVIDSKQVGSITAVTVIMIREVWDISS